MASETESGWQRVFPGRPASCRPVRLIQLLLGAWRELLEHFVHRLV